MDLEIIIKIIIASVGYSRERDETVNYIKNESSRKIIQEKTRLDGKGIHWELCKRLKIYPQIIRSQILYIYIYIYMYI